MEEGEALVRRGRRGESNYGGAYLERAAPRLARARFLASTFACGLFMELGPGSNWPGWISGSGRPALAFRFLAFCAAFAFARARAFALVMSSSRWWGPRNEEEVAAHPHRRCSRDQGTNSEESEWGRGQRFSTQRSRRRRLVTMLALAVLRLSGCLTSASLGHIEGFS